MQSHIDLTSNEEITISKTGPGQTRVIYDDRRTGHRYGMTRWIANIPVYFQCASHMKRRIMLATSQ